MTETLAIESQCHLRASERWHSFLTRRSQWLATEERVGRAAEKVAENVVTDLLTEVLDWTRGDVNYQVDRSDIVVTQKAIKRLLIESKAPGRLGTRHSVEQALEQAKGYATEQYVKAVAVSDGALLYVADMLGGAYRDRLLTHLDQPAPEPELWYVSVHGIYRDPPRCDRPLLDTLEPPAPGTDANSAAGAALSAPGKKIGGEPRPAECFAYVGDLAKPSTWKLPYLLPSGEADPRRLPMAVGAGLRNYRGRSVGISEKAVDEVLFRLGRAAWRATRFPEQAARVPDAFRDLKEVLLQLGLWDEVRMENPPPWDEMDRTSGM